jgi:death-on-curing family protein
VIYATIKRKMFMKQIPSVNEITSIHEHLVKLFEDGEDPISPPGVKSQALLESAQSRPSTAMGRTEKYPEFYSKAAALFHSLTKNHAFHNGNKRTALVVLLTMLYRNDKALRQDVTDDILYDFVLAVTSDAFPSAEHGLSADEVIVRIKKWIRDHVESSVTKLSDMDTSTFVMKCEQAGAHVKKSSTGNYAVSREMRSVSIGKSKRKLSGNVIRTYLRRLGLTATSSGVTMIEFVEGVTSEREQIRRFMTTLTRLAKT